MLSSQTHTRKHAHVRKHLNQQCALQRRSRRHSKFIQSTLVISTSLISNNHLSRSEYLVPV